MRRRVTCLTALGEHVRAESKLPPSASSDMQEALAAHFVRRGLLASCGVRRKGRLPSGLRCLDIAVRAIINLIKRWRAAFWPRFCFASCHVGVVATCIFASILQSKAPAYRPRTKNRDFSMFSTNDGRGYGPTALDLQGYSRSLAFIVAPDALGYVEYSQKCTVLRGGPSRQRKPPRRSMHSTGRFMHIPE